MIANYARARARVYILFSSTIFLFYSLQEWCNLALPKRDKSTENLVVQVQHV